MESSLAKLGIALIVLYLAGSLPGLIRPARWANRGTYFSLGIAILGGLTAMAGAIYFWNHPGETAELLQTLVLPSLPEGIVPFKNFLSLSLYIDHLAALFLGLTGFFSAVIGIYSVSWLREQKERGHIAAIFNFFVLCAMLVVLADTVYFWLVFLESMTLSFAYLVLYRHNKFIEGEQIPDESNAEWRASKNAFKIYLIFSHIGIMFITVALLTLGLEAGSFSFTAFRELGKIQIIADQTPLEIRNAVFLLALAGLGIKAGIVPAHVWVSLVHPYSPTNIHTMLSGVAMKVAGMYGMYRIFLQFLYPVEWWWGGLLLLLAGLTALVGVFYALAGTDLKKTLASHSVENIGIICVGLGLALIYKSLGSLDSAYGMLGGVALVASVYHLVNHSIFKGLLFLCTGAIERLTGSVEFEKLGGLARRYPWTAGFFLIGAISIAGFPPFNGFISEWLTLQALFAGKDIFGTPHGPWMLITFLVTILLLGTAFGLTALAFTKIAGETLLGAPRMAYTPPESTDKDVDWHMRAVMGMMAGLCLLLGLLPGVVAPKLGEIATDMGLSAEGLKPQTIGLEVSLQFQPSDSTADRYRARLSGRFLIVLAGVVLLPAGWGIYMDRKLRKHKESETPAWASLGSTWRCGSTAIPETTQISGSALWSLIWQPLAAQLPPTGSPPDGPIPWRLALSEHHSLREVFVWMLDRLVNWLVNVSQRFGDWFQPGDIRRYLTYIFITFTLILVWLFFTLQGASR